MDYQYKIIISNRNVYREFEITEDMERVKLGTNSGCEFRLNPESFFSEIEIEFQEKGHEWIIDCSDSVYFSKGDMRKLYSTGVKHGDVLSVCYSSTGNEVFELRFMIDFEAKVPNYNWYINLPDSLLISTEEGADIHLNSQFGEKSKLRLYKNGNRFILEELASEFGVLCNGQKIDGSIELKDFDFFSVAEFWFYYKEGKLFFDKNGLVIRENEISEVKKCDTFNYPLFVRSSRVKVQLDTKEIAILDPAAKPSKPELNIVTSLMPTLVMFGLVVVLRGVMSDTGGTYVLFSICSMGMGVITSIASIVNSQRKYKKECKKRVNDYQNYIEKKREEISTFRQKELDCMNNIYYSIQQDIKNALEFNHLLFDRTEDDEDFLDIFLGIGKQEATKKIRYKVQEKLESGDELSMIPQDIAENFRYIDNAPIYVKIKEANAIGVVGEEEYQYSMFKNILIDISARQYYGDVKICAMIDDNTKKYEWMRLLPHVNSFIGIRGIVNDVESKNLFFESLYKELTYRVEHKKEKFEYIVILVMNEHGLKSHPISKFIEHAAEIKVCFIFFENREEYLPLYCSEIIRLVDRNKGILFSSENENNKLNFKYESIEDDVVMSYCRQMAPISCEEISLESALRKNISLFELLGIYAVDDLDMRERWRTAQIYNTMGVPLGVNVKNDIVYLDLHEKYHGPHGLVAGTTGSGKSEILQTYILGAATLFHPYEIGFLIIDFKGGGMVNQFKNLPHLVGAITNIDGKAIERSLKSIKAELLKRQNLFAEADVNHIDKYIKAYKEGKLAVALPHLVIIVDEFAELKAEQPEFMKELISAARIGRSLGVHLILATQKPAGQVNEQIWSNSKFKLCLKVQTPEDSNEVLKSPLAAEIREPGRAYLQVGNNEIFELFQSGFSGAPEKVDEQNVKKYDIYEVQFNGKRRVAYQQKTEQTNNKRTQLDAIVAYVAKYCEEANIKRLPAICLPALEKEIYYVPETKKASREELRCVIGVYDDPDEQYQGTVEIDFATQNTVIIGSAQYGKTTLLELMIRDIAENYTPQEVSMYIIDFGSMVLKNFEKLAHVGGVVCPSDDEKLRNLFKFLGDQVAERRSKLVSMGVSSFSSYREAGYRDLAQIVVLIDNFTALKELYLQDSDILLSLCRDGISVGITFVIANAVTSGMGYKYLANFSNRIALFCNEKSEYGSLFGTYRTSPDAVPGRGITEIDKKLCEYQTYLPFEGEKEIERVRAMQKFVDETNDRNRVNNAILIPEIPETLDECVLISQYETTSTSSSKILLGIDYTTILPISLEMMKYNIIGISGREESGKHNFISYLVHAIQHLDSNAEITIFDNYKKKLKKLEGEHVSYCMTVDSITETFLNLEKCLQERYQLLVNDSLGDVNWKVIVINNSDAIDKLGTDKNALMAYKNAISKYKMLKVFVIVGSVPNASLAYGAPEVLKALKDTKNILFFDDLENCKVVDIPLAVARQHRKKIELGDGFYINGNDCYKIKTPKAF